MEVTIRALEPGDKLTGLSLGDHKYVALKIFLQRHAKIYQSANLGMTYVAFNKETERVCAYITILCGEVLTKKSQFLDDVEDYRYPSYPALKIARLAVDASCRGKNIGSKLVQVALGIAKDLICPHVGCRFIMVDSKLDAVEFYEKCGFTLLDTRANRRRPSPVMFIDLGKV